MNVELILLFDNKNGTKADDEKTVANISPEKKEAFKQYAEQMHRFLKEAIRDAHDQMMPFFPESSEADQTGT